MHFFFFNTISYNQIFTLPEVKAQAVNIGGCSGFDIYKLLLAMIIVSFVGIGCSSLKVVQALIDCMCNTFIFAGKTSYSFTMVCDCVSSLLNIAVGVMQIVMAVMLWNSNCKSEAKELYIYLTPWLVAQFILNIVSIVFALVMCCLSVSIGCFVAIMASV